MKFSLCTLGCKVNHYESQVLRRMLLDQGAEQVPFGDPCDLSIVHSCAVTEESARKSRQMMRRARRASPEGAVAVIGCLAQTEPDTLPEADIVLGNQNKTLLPSLAEAFFRERKPLCRVAPILSCHSFEEMSLSSDEHVRATVKIQDGCCNFCSYCVIPYARGPIRSKPIDDAVSEVAGLVAKGYREIVLTGIHLDSYGREHGKFNLFDLLERLDSIPGLERIRLGSTEPIMVTEQNVARMKSLKHLCHHFNLSLQSGCTKTLKRMRRRYTAEEYDVFARRLKEAFDDVSLSTDIIVGFPGETEEDFLETVAFAEKIGFSKINVFPFSPRKGTAAWDFDGQVPMEEKKRRCRVLLDVSTRAERDFCNRFVGTTAEVLFESYKNGVCYGFTSNYVSVRVKSNKCLIGQLLPVEIRSADGSVCEGDLKLL